MKVMCNSIIRDLFIYKSTYHPRNKKPTGMGICGCVHQKCVHFLDIISYEMLRDTKYSYLFQIFTYRLKTEESHRETRLSVREIVGISQCRG